MELEEKTKANKNLYKSFDIKYDKKIYSIEIKYEEKEKKEEITFKAYEKSSISKIFYTNSFNFDNLLKMTKAFRMCDNFNEVYLMIIQKFEEKEITLFLENDLQIIIEFVLPNKKTDKIKLDLFQQKLLNSELIERLYENISYLQDKNKSLEEQIKMLKPKTLVDLMGDTFKVSNFYILKMLYSNLEQSSLQDDYLKEILNKFQSNIKNIFDAQKDGDTISGLISTVFGKTNLVCYISYLIFNKMRSEYEYDFGEQFLYFDGKLEFENGLLSFFKKNLFTFGSYGSSDLNPVFTFYREDNAKIFLKMGKNCIYFITTYSEKYLKKCLKVNEHFIKNPVFFIDWEHEIGVKEMETISDEKFNELVKNDFEVEKIIIHIKEFKIFQIGD